ncbi:MAG: hypothetical protein JWM89_712 [Acidimicrobiales bacterium]|nr:hypothetical protein [Acidimicrobiales bacterium]
MLGRKDYTRDELDNGKAAVGRQLAAHETLAEAIAADEEAAAAFEAFDGQLFNNLMLMLDRLYVHRVRAVTGKDTNPLNEVELICESLMNNGGVFEPGKVVKYKQDESVLKLAPGDEIHLSAAGFERLSAAFFAELEARFVAA